MLHVMETDIEQQALEFHKDSCNAWDLKILARVEENLNQKGGNLHSGILKRIAI